MSEVELFKAGGKFVPCKLDMDLYIFNPKVTTKRITVYTGLRVKQFKKKYLIADKEDVSESFTAPEGSIVHVHYRTGSHSNVKHAFSLFFLVEEGATVTLTVEDRGEESRIETRNLRLLQKPDEDTLTNIEAEILNKYGAKPSQYDPVLHLYYFWISSNITGEGAKKRPEVRALELAKIIDSEVSKYELEEAKKLVEKLLEYLENIREQLS